MSDVEDEVRSTWAVKSRKASLIPSSDSTVPLVRQANDAEELIYLRCDAFRKKILIRKGRSWVKHL